MLTRTSSLLLFFSCLALGCSGSDATITGDEADVTGKREAFSQSCTLSRLYDDNVFEEGLSKEEYPDVSIERDGKTGEITVDIGSANYSSKDKEMTVKLVKKSDTDSETSIVMKAGVSYFLRLSATKGTITTAEGKKAETKVADLKCDAPKLGGGTGGASCPPNGSINCMPPTTNPYCSGEKRAFVQKNCPGVSYLD